MPLGGYRGAGLMVFTPVVHVNYMDYYSFTYPGGMEG